jgi:recombination protein RecA
MSKKAKNSDTEQSPKNETVLDDFTSQLIKDINKEMGERCCYNLSEMTAPTIVKRWLDTGSIALNYAIRNAFGGGYPEGRIIEITGQPSSGKSHLGYHAAAIVQKMGGIVVLIDSENATPLDKLHAMGINVRHRFVYVDCHVVEDVFKVIESVITKVKNVPTTKDVPILIIWDSVAATSPKAEIEGEYDDKSVGLKARVISQAMRKITGVIGKNNVTFLIINQLREMIGVMHGDPLVAPGGKSVPFHSTIRIRLSGGCQVKDSSGNVIGIHVIVTIKKNKVAPPFRKCEFDIIFGKGIDESEFLFDTVRSYCTDHEVIRDGHQVSVTGTGAWKELQVTDTKTGEVLIEKKFYKSEFGTLMKDKQYAPFLLEALDEALTIKSGEMGTSEGDEHDSGEEEPSDE